MKKHQLNILPEPRAEDFARLRDDIKQSGYDVTYPITLYQGDVLDGWTRVVICKELGITPPTTDFNGNDDDAMAFVMRSNKRRNLTSGQWAAIAVESVELMNALAQQAKERHRAAVSAPRRCDTSQKIDQFNERKSDHKAAELFNTNRTYISQAEKLKKSAPHLLERVKGGKMTMQDAARAARAIPTNPWSDDEKKRKDRVSEGGTVLANAECDKSLIQWATEKGLAVRIDRGTEFGNPFILGEDGSREQVCNSYRDHYLPFKPSIKAKLPSLRGKVLVCHCYPARCHGEALIHGLR